MREPISCMINNLAKERPQRCLITHQSLAVFHRLCHHCHAGTSWKRMQNIRNTQGHAQNMTCQSASFFSVVSVCSRLPGKVHLRLEGGSPVDYAFKVDVS